MKINMLCCCCGKKLSDGLTQWHFICNFCGYECSSFLPSVNNTQIKQQLNEEARELGLRELRIANFRIILKMIKRMHPNYSNENLLDVGAAHGWFVQLAKGIFENSVGIEPDVNLVDLAKKNGIILKQGFFPECLSSSDFYDVIIFNDVFEHMFDASLAIKSVHSHLKKNGLLILNLPVTNGFFYQISKFLLNFGINEIFNRMWQKGMPSPHIHYFSQINLNLLLSNHGFVRAGQITLPAITLKGLYGRISLSRQHNLISRMLILLGIIIVYHLLSVFPKDIRVYAFNKSY
jgi:2-polyprenyl-3-methyl-5-hydroxy-6-metoxy-1,4-benzoquinol methylase